MYETSLSSVTDEVEALLVSKLSAKGRTLQDKIKHVGRALPSNIRAYAQYLIDAEARYQNPKMAHQYDPKRLLEAQKNCIAYLEQIDPSRQKSFRRTAVLVGAILNLGILAAIAYGAYSYWIAP